MKSKSETPESSGLSDTAASELVRLGLGPGDTRLEALVTRVSQEDGASWVAAHLREWESRGLSPQPRSLLKSAEEMRIRSSGSEGNAGAALLQLLALALRAADTADAEPALGTELREVLDDIEAFLPRAWKRRLGRGGD